MKFIDEMDLKEREIALKELEVRVKARDADRRERLDTQQALRVAK